MRDRCTKAHEYIFLLSKSARYYYDADAVKEQGDKIGTVKHLCSAAMENVLVAEKDFGAKMLPQEAGGLPSGGCYAQRRG